LKNDHHDMTHPAVRLPLVGNPLRRADEHSACSTRLDRAAGCANAWRPFDDKETAAPMTHPWRWRARRSRWSRTIAVTLVHRPGRAIPRAVNNALQALVAPSHADKAIVDESSTRTDLAEARAD